MADNIDPVTLDISEFYARCQRIFISRDAATVNGFIWRVIVTENSNPITLDISELCSVTSFCHVSNITCLISELFGNWFVCGSGQWYFYGFRAYASQTRWQKWLKQWCLFRQVMFLTLSGSPWSLLYTITWLNFIRSRENE